METKWCLQLWKPSSKTWETAKLCQRKNFRAFIKLFMFIINVSWAWSSILKFWASYFHWDVNVRTRTRYGFETHSYRYKRSFNRAWFFFKNMDTCIAYGNKIVILFLCFKSLNQSSDFPLVMSLMTTDN